MNFVSDLVNRISSDRGVPDGRDGRVLRCIGTDDWNESTHDTARASFDLPVSAPLLFLLSRGNLAHGSVNLVTSDTDSKDITVDLVARYRTVQTRDRASVCLLEREDGSTGIGIYTPYLRFPMSDSIRFEITLKLPVHQDAKEPLVIKAFQTSMGIFSHTIDDLMGRVYFHSIDLVGSNAFITAESLGAGEISLKTSNGHIRGTYNSTTTLTAITSNAAVDINVIESSTTTIRSSNARIKGDVSGHDVSLVTSNSLIDVQVRLENVNEDLPAQLKMVTSNGRITAAVDLESGRDDGNGGVFGVSSTTSNNQIDLSFPVAPISSKLSVSSTTSNGPTSISLHPTYEGTFSLVTSNTSPRVETTPEADDPTGQGRERVVNITRNVKGVVEGEVTWGKKTDDTAKAGQVKVRTSNSGIVLKLQKKE